MSLRFLWTLYVYILIFACFYFFSEVAFAENMFGNTGSDNAVKASVKGLFERAFDFMTWLGGGFGFLAAVIGFIQLNGFFGDAKRGQELIKSGLIVAGVCATGQGVKAIIGFFVG
jgi:hypothetical protein